jgi:beta-phosphoglucomutase-like phosphatase (HAD superfamily)
MGNFPGEMMAKALLSDIDGTLVDSNALHAEAWRRAFEHFGIDVGNLKAAKSSSTRELLYGPVQS